MATFDLAAKVVTEQQKAWVIHAGKAQKYTTDFHSKEAIFLETPYLDLTDINLQSRSIIRQAMRRAHAIENHKKTYGSEVPSDKIIDYDDSPFKETAYTSLTSGIARMFGVMKRGDIIISPGIIPAEDYNIPAIHFGEVLTDFNTSDTLSAINLNLQKIPYRAVRWLKSVPRKNISLYLERRIGKPPALREIPIERDTEEILQHAYKSYIFGETSSGMIEASKYTGSDFMILTDAQRLIAALVAAHHVYTNQGSIPKITDLDAFIKENFHNAAIENIVIDFASPGSWKLIGASASMAAFVGLGIAVLTSDTNFDTLSSDLIVTNSISTVGKVEEASEDGMKMLFNSLDNLELEKARSTAQEAKEMIGFTSSVHEAAP